MTEIENQNRSFFFMFYSKVDLLLNVPWDFILKINFLFPSLKGEKFLENSSKLYSLGFWE